MNIEVRLLSNGDEAVMQRLTADATASRCLGRRLASFLCQPRRLRGQLLHEHRVDVAARAVVDALAPADAAATIAATIPSKSVTSNARPLVKLFRIESSSWR